MSLSIRDLLLGKRLIPSRVDFKYAMLRAEFSVLLIVVAAFYIVLDYVNGMVEFYPWYGLMIIIGIGCIVMNRLGYFRMVNLSLLLTINAFVFIFADVDHQIGGVFFYFMTVSCVGLILFSKEENRWLQFFFGILPICLGVIAFLWDFGVVGFPSQDQEVMKISFVANFTVGILSTFFVVHFLITRNKESEESLMKSEAAMKRTSEDLKKSEERYLMALQGTRAGIYEWRVQENRVEVSSHWKSLLGYASSEMAEVKLETFLTLIHPDDSERVSASVMDYIKNQQPYQNEVRLRTKNGDYRWFQDSGVGKADAFGNLEVVIGSIIDIHERKEAEEKIRHQNELLAKANKELDHFVYSVSHDLRAPLSSILGLTSIYGLSKSSEEKNDVVRMIGDRANVLDEFIREVLDYSKNSRLEVRPQPVVLWEIVDEVISGLAHMDGFTTIDVRTAIPSELTVTSDRERLRVVLSNLLSNAIKYRDPGKDSFILVKAFRNEKEWQLEIQDNGMGIREVHLPHIFEMFYKAHDTSRGTGLGLYIVQEAMQRIKGAVEVESEYGKGSTFRLVVSTKS